MKWTAEKKLNNIIIDSPFSLKNRNGVSERLSVRVLAKSERVVPGPAAFLRIFRLFLFLKEQMNKLQEI